ncbi:MAG: class I SAM-dependent methyltransferase [Proteobacteria bacterium]|nr:class I SAM-dependent methyltransferase [Pseudomonadota bacterium]
MLEIGVGSGSFLAYANSYGYIPLGCDLSAGICRRVEQNTGIAMHKGSIESLPDEQQFDVVVMNHILEHVSDPLAFLKDVLDRLKPGGLMHLAVPNVASWEARLPGWNSYEPYHLHYFSPQTLQFAAEKAGFKIQLLTTHESFSGWFLAILRTLLRKSHSRQSQQEISENIMKSNIYIDHVYRLVMIICGFLTLPFRRFQEFIGRGDEIILIGRNETDE